MPQIFRARANAWVRWGLIAAIVGLSILMVGAFVFFRSPYVTGVGRYSPQPVPFSHRHHVGALGIGCRYCHTSYERAAFAGLPTTTICMSCHSRLWTNAPMLAPVRRSLTENRPIRWRRVHDLPDYVYFDHSAHVNNGVGCESCHGRVDQMPLTRQAEPLAMGWCLDCHRNPGPRLRPRDHITDMGWEPQGDPQAMAARLLDEYRIHAAQLTDCSICHR